MTKHQVALGVVVLGLLTGTMVAFESGSAWVDILAPICVVAGVVQMGWVARGFLAHRH